MPYRRAVTRVVRVRFFGGGEMGEPTPPPPSMHGTQLAPVGGDPSVALEPKGGERDPLGRREKATRPLRRRGEHSLGVPRVLTPRRGCSLAAELDRCTCPSQPQGGGDVFARKVA